MSLIRRNNTVYIASKYVKKQQNELVSRGFLFVIPPFLGILLAQKNIDMILYSFGLSSFIATVLTLIQTKKYFTNITIHKLELLKILYLFSLGALIYTVFLFAPFYLNIIGYYFQDHNLWIVQLSPLLTGVSSILIYYHLEPKIAMHIDKNNNYDLIKFEFSVIRILGRSINFFLSIALIMIFNQS